MNELKLYPDSNVEQDELDDILTKLNSMTNGPIDRLRKIMSAEDRYKEKMTAVLSAERIIEITGDVLLSLSSIDKNYRINEFNCILDDMYDAYIPEAIKAAIVKKCGTFYRNQEPYLANLTDLIFGNVLRNLVLVVDNVKHVEKYDDVLEISREQYFRTEEDIAKTFTWLYPILAPTFIIRPYGAINVLVNEYGQKINIYKGKTERSKIKGVYTDNQYQFIHYEYFNPEGTGFSNGTVYNEAWEIITDIVDIAQPIIGDDAFLNTSAIIAILHAYLEPHHCLRYIEFLSPFIYLQIDATKRRYGKSAKYRHINDNLKGGIKLSSDRQLSIYTKAYKYRDDGEIKSSVSDENGCSILTVDMLAEDGIIWDATFQAYANYTHRLNYRYFDYDKKILRNEVKLYNRDSVFHKHQENTDSKKYGYYIDYSLFNRGYNVNIRDIGDEITIDLMCREIVHDVRYIAVKDEPVALETQQRAVRDALQAILSKFDNISTDRIANLADTLTRLCWPRFAKLFPKPVDEPKIDIVKQPAFIPETKVTFSSGKTQKDIKKEIETKIHTTLIPADEMTFDYAKNSANIDARIKRERIYGGKPSESFMAVPVHISLEDMLPETDLGIQHAMYADIIDPYAAYYFTEEMGHGFDMAVATNEWRHRAHAQYAAWTDLSNERKELKAVKAAAATRG